MSEVSCTCLDFNPDWDTKLNKLLSYANAYLLGDHRIRFKIPAGHRKVFFFFTEETYDVYDVWLSNKSGYYGHLDSFNYKRIPFKLTYAASQETLDKLHELEFKLKNKNFDYNRIYK